MFDTHDRDVSVLVRSQDVVEESIHLPLVPLQQLRDVPHTFRTSAGQLNAGVNGQPRVEQLVGALGLGIGLLQQGRPELNIGGGLHVEEETLARGQQVVDHNLDPAPKPESKVEDAGIVLMLREALHDKEMQK